MVSPSQCLSIAERFVDKDPARQCQDGIRGQKLWQVPENLPPAGPISAGEVCQAAAQRVQLSSQQRRSKDKHDHVTRDRATVRHKVSGEKL